MLKPAGSCRKSKPDLIWRASRFAPMLRAKPIASASSTSASAPCSAHSRIRRARCRARHAASPIGVSLIAAGRAPGRPKPARIPSGDRPMYSSGEGHHFSADRRRVHQAALGPQVVDAARQPDRGLRPEVALEAFAVVADLLDDAVRPLLVQAEQLAGVFRDTEETLHARVLAARLLLVDVRLRQAVLLGLEHREA